MHEHWHAAFGSDAKHFNDFLMRRPGRALNTHADAGPAEGGRARPGMAGGLPEIDECAIAALVEKLTHVGRANFELQCGGHTVHRLQTVACSGLVVLMEINEAGSDDKAGRVNDVHPNQRLLADDSNPAAANTNVADSVKRGFRIDDASAVDRQVIRNLRESRAANNQNK
jgi:hypothetical protein